MFFVGLVIGGCVGLAVIAILQSGKQSDLIMENAQLNRKIDLLLDENNELKEMRNAFRKELTEAQKRLRVIQLMKEVSNA
jgi:acyl carrier protein phosphodiesterase